MESVFGLPLALVVFLAGVLVLLTSAVLHWVLLITGAVLVVAGVYLFLFGGSLPM
jgi:hypothetical protein